MLVEMTDAAARRRHRERSWSAKLFQGPGTLEAMERDALDEWASLEPVYRLALTWELSLAQYGGAHADAMEPRLPRSAYRVERR